MAEVEVQDEETVTAVEESDETETEPEETEKPAYLMPKGLFQSLMEWVAGLGKGRQKSEEQSRFKVLPDGRWFAAFTNNFEDRDQEILTGVAHKRYVARVKSGFTPLPELWLNHILGTRHGVAEYVDYWEDDSGLVGVYAVGRFDETPLGQLMAKVYSSQKLGDTALSHGFKYPSYALAGKFYFDYNTFEISTLAPHRASNPFTSFTGDVLPMTTLSDKQKQELVERFGEKVAEQIMTNVSDNQKALQSARDILGTQFKDFAHVPDDPTTPSEKATTDGALSLIPQLVEDLGEAVKMLATLSNVVSKTTDQRTKETSSLDERFKKIEAALGIGTVPASKDRRTLVESPLPDVMSDLEKKKAPGNLPFSNEFPDLYT